MPNVYVLSKSGMPLMPMHRFGRVKRMLHSNKARVVNVKPFTIQLTYEIEKAVTSSCILGIDPGRTNIGLCVIDEHGSVLYTSDLVTRNKMIAKLMLERKAHRQESRRGERKRRQRRAIAADKIGMTRATEFYRMLPGCEEPIRCKHIRNTEARFNNRKRPAGWLTPTANHLLQTHLNAVKLVAKILPISELVLEINRFDFVRLENPNVQNWEYQKGKLFGYKSREDAVYDRQNGHCIFCKRDITQYHHVVPKSKDGSESVDNIAGVCDYHHELVHTETEWEEKLKTKQHGVLKKYHALSVVNQIMPKLIQQLSELHPLYVTTGYETSLIRDSLGLDKDHCLDAYCIALSHLGVPPDEIPTFEDIYNIQQFRRHDRQLIRAQRERTYKLDGVVVAKNRHKRFEQKNDSLAEFALEPSRFDMQIDRYEKHTVLQQSKPIDARSDISIQWESLRNEWTAHIWDLFTCG